MDKQATAPPEGGVALAISMRAGWVPRPRAATRQSGLRSGLRSLRVDQRGTGVAEAVAGGLPPGSTTTRLPTFTRP